MKGEHNSDRAIERLLRETRRHTASSQPCVDAETLAAWSEGTLPAAEMRLVEGHASVCDRCQSVLAAFARAEPRPIVAAAPFWHRWRLQWLVPAAAMATALAVWVAVPRERPAPQPSAETEQRTAAVSPRPQAQPRGGSAQPEASPAARASAQKRATNPGAPGQSGQLRTPAPGRPEPDTSRLEEARPTGAAKLESGAPREQPAREMADQQAVRESLETANKQPSNDAARAAPPPGQSTGAPEGVRRPSGADAAATPPLPPPPPAARVTPAPPPAGAAAGAALLRSDQVTPTTAPVPFDVSSPDAVHRWRVDANGQVQHSSSGGNTWQPVALDAAGMLTAGSSPTGAVCWLVGRNGVVWVTSDGLGFARRSLSEPADLMAVRATDARRATVVARDGRTFVTTDAGVNWTLAPR